MISSALEMVDVLDLPTFLRLILRVTMETMRFHMAQTNLFRTTMFCI